MLAFEDLFTTVYHCMGIVADKELMAPGARPIEIIDGGGPVLSDELSRFFERIDHGAGASNELGNFMALTLAAIDGGDAAPVAIGGAGGAADRDGRGVAAIISLPLGPSAA